MNHIYVLLKKSVFVVLIYVMIGSISAQVTWDKYQNNPILKTGDAETWESVVSVIISVVYHDGMYKAWVSGADETDTGRIGYATSEDGIVWTRYENNPVLVPGDAGAWDDTNADHACVLFVDSTFKMWYMAEDEESSQIGYATSSDGVSWEKYSGNPVLNLGTTGTWDEEEVMHPSVIFDGETYHMWYNGYGQEMQRTGYATSLDGISWNKHPGNPVMTTGVSGSWDDHMLGLMSVIYKDGEFKMWYTAGDGTGDDSRYFRIGYATSTDGISWDKHKDNPILDIGEVGSWDSLGVVTSAVLFDSTENKYKMWYGGFDGSSFQTGYATSADVSEVENNINLNGPENFSLHQNYPNPFNPVTIINWQLAVGSDVELTLYNILGEKLVTLINKYQEPGKHKIEWNAAGYPTGVYLYRIKTDHLQDVKKMILVR